MTRLSSNRLCRLGQSQPCNASSDRSERQRISLWSSSSLATSKQTPQIILLLNNQLATTATGSGQARPETRPLAAGADSFLPTLVVASLGRRCLVSPAAACCFHLLSGSRRSSSRRRRQVHGRTGEHGRVVDGLLLLAAVAASRLSLCCVTLAAVR